MIIRAKTLRAWMKRNFCQRQLREIVEHGCGAGWHGLTYYADTDKLFSRFEEEVVDILSDFCEPLTFDPSEESMSMFRCKLVWMACSIVASDEVY